MSNAAPATSAEPLPLDDLQGSTDLAHEKGRWTLWVIGKGGKKAGLPPPPTLVRDLTEYQLAKGLPASPAIGERPPCSPSCCNRPRASRTTWSIAR